MSYSSDKSLEKSTNLDKKSTFEFHVSKESRQKYNFDEEIFSITGNVVFANNVAVRKFTQKLNEQRSNPAVPARVQPLPERWSRFDIRTAAGEDDGL